MVIGMLVFTTPVHLPRGTTDVDRTNRLDPLRDDSARISCRSDRSFARLPPGRAARTLSADGHGIDGHGVGPQRPGLDNPMGQALGMQIVGGRQDRLRGIFAGARPIDQRGQASMLEIGRATLSSGCRSALTPISSSTSAAAIINPAPNR